MTEPATGPATPRPSRQVRDRALMQGVAWTGGAKWITQGLSWASTIVVARLLSVEDYGVVGATMIVVGFIQVLNEFGLGAAVVSQRDLTDRQHGALATFSLCLGTLLAVAVYLGASLVAAFYRQADVAPVLRLLSITFVSMGLSVVPRALLTRDLKYSRLALIDSLEALTAIAVTLVLALQGARFWSLAIGTVSGRLVAAATTLWFRRVRLVWPSSVEEVRRPLEVGSHVVTGGIAWYAFRSADANLVTRRLGIEAQGFYGIAVALSTIPLDRLNELVNRVMPGILSDVQSDRAELGRYVVRVSQALSLVSFPVATGLALTAGDVIPLMLGAKWSTAASVLRLLALSALVRSLATVLNQTLVITGRSRQSMIATIAALFVMPPAFWLGTFLGLNGVAAVWCLVYPVVMGPALFQPALRAAGVPLARYLAALRPALEASLFMSAVVLAIGVLAGTWPPAVRLGAEVAAGVAAYAGYLLLLHRSRMVEYSIWLRGLRSAAAPASPS